MLVMLNQNPALDGGVLGWKNCNTTCTAMQIHFEKPSLKPDGGDVRKCCLNPNGTLDVTGGTNISQNVEAAKRCFGVELDFLQTAFERIWTLGQRVDVAISISIHYSVISGTKFDGSPGFRSNHQVVLSGGKVFDPLADGRRPGIPKGPQPWPKTLLMRAAGRVNVAAPGQAYRALGEGTCLAVIAYAPKPNPVKRSVRFEPGAIFVYNDTGSTWTRERDGFSKATSARCGVPTTIPWIGGRKRVVEVLAGRLKGKYVEPGASHVRLVGGV